MTRERAAKLLRCWRRAKAQGARVFDLECVRDSCTRAYLVHHVQTGERGGLYIKAGADATSHGFAPESLLVVDFHAEVTH
jgi:hypothetical protein